MNGDFPAEILVQGGAVGISIALVILLYLRGKAQDKLVENHTHKTDEIIADNTKAMAKMSGVVADNTHAIDRNTEVSKRMERVLDRR